MNNSCNKQPCSVAKKYFHLYFPPTQASSSQGMLCVPLVLASIITLAVSRHLNPDHAQNTQFSVSRRDVPTSTNFSPHAGVVMTNLVHLYNFYYGSWSDNDVDYLNQYSAFLSENPWFESFHCLDDNLAIYMYLIFLLFHHQLWQR